MNRTKKGSIEVGKFADLAVLSHDYFSKDEENIRSIESILTIVGGKVVYATNDFQNLAPNLYQLSLHGQRLQHMVEIIIYQIMLILPLKINILNLRYVLIILERKKLM